MSKSGKEDRANSALTDLSSDLLCSKKKSDELFLYWISQPETQESINSMIAQSADIDLGKKLIITKGGDFGTRRPKDERISVFHHPAFNLDIPKSEDAIPKSPRETFITSTSRGNITSRIKNQV
jgi:hypothetical protein